MRLAMVTVAVLCDVLFATIGPDYTFQTFQLQISTIGSYYRAGRTDRLLTRAAQIHDGLARNFHLEAGSRWLLLTGDSCFSV